MKSSLIENTFCGDDAAAISSAHNAASNSQSTSNIHAVDDHDGRISLARLATEKNIPLHEIIESIQEVIDLAWASPTPEQKMVQSKLFPDGKPSPAHFVGRLSREIINMQ